MKQYVIDELRPEDHEKIKTYLDEHFGPADMGDIYWIPLDPALYDVKQQSHEECRPFYFTIHLSSMSLIVELLVRTKSRIRCDCIKYATKEQFFWLICFVDAILERLEIIA
jgi:hypothetical protein